MFLYILRCDKYFKIGTTNNVPKRVSSIHTGNPFDVVVVEVYELSNAVSMEKLLHQKFSRKKHRGEWFILEREDLNEISTACQILGGRVLKPENAVAPEAPNNATVNISWRNARKTMTIDDVVKIANGWISDISNGYGVTERTASNWKRYAKIEIEVGKDE